MFPFCICAEALMDLSFKIAYLSPIAVAHFYYERYGLYSK